MASILVKSKIQALLHMMNSSLDLVPDSDPMSASIKLGIPSISRIIKRTHDTALANFLTFDLFTNLSEDRAVKR